MRSVILCEGTDDLWFLAYYLHKAKHWNVVKRSQWKGAKIPADVGSQDVQYMELPDTAHMLAIKSTDGQGNLEKSAKDILKLIEDTPTFPVDNLIIFRDCDDRTPEELTAEMETWFPNGIALENDRESKYVVSQMLKDEYDFELTVLPLIIPFDEAGAIETLLVQAIADHSVDGKYAAEHAKQYIDDAHTAVSEYLQSQRSVTKAKYAAAMSIVDPTHSRDEFRKLMMATPWEESAAIKNHMSNASRIICQEREAAGV